MINESDLISVCIEQMRSEMLETKNEIRSLEKELKAYEKVIDRLEKCKEEFIDARFR